MDAEYQDIIDFHGHSCPGLAIGYRMAKAGLGFLSGARSEDEEIVAIVENDACGVDALQCVTGCTFGKGNLIFKDHGKHVFTIYNRASRRGVRVVFNHQNIPENLGEDREELVQWILRSPDDAVVAVKSVEIEEPEPARIMDSVVCALCNERVMETRTVVVDNQLVCIPCSKEGKP